MDSNCKNLIIVDFMAKFNSRRSFNSVIIDRFTSNINGTNFKNIFIFIFIFGLYINKGVAQVTIGTNIPPQKSALMELKEYEPTTDNVTATKGFVMPRVKLVSRTSLSPIISDTDVNAEEKKNNVGLQVYHVGGGNMKEGTKVWYGTHWSDLDNSILEVKNGLSKNQDTLEFGGSLVKPTKIIATTQGSNFEYNALQANANMLVTGNAKLGINTNAPLTSVDINGDLAIRNIPVLEDGFFTDIGVDQMGKVYRRNESFTSYSVYLGFDPMAQSHIDTIPLTLEAGYIYKIEGISIGACEGTLTYFTITFVGTRYVGATLQAVATRDNSTKVFAPVILTAAQPIFNVNRSLESLAGQSGCGSTYGHTLQYLTDKNQLVVSFKDEKVYFKDAGTFAITNLIQLSILGTNQTIE